MLSKNNNKRFRGNQLGNRAGNASTMPDSPERKPALKLALFLGLSESLSPAADHPPPLARSPKSPRSFDDGAVGLGIVAAMSGGGGDRAPPLARAAPPPPSARSDPIPIVSPRMWTVERPKVTEWDAGDEEDDELSESYTCVISHVAGDAVKKRVYYDDGSDGLARNYGRNTGVFYQSPPPPPPPPLEAADFLSRCYLCRKNLHGLDIFMYRGDKAFCSAECRCQQIVSDEYRENCGYGAVKAFEYSVSPCSTPFFFSAGVAAA